MDNASLCQLIREALHSPEKAEALALAIDQIPEIKTYLGKGYLPYYDAAILVTIRDVERNINKFPQMKGLDLETIDCHNPVAAKNVREKFISWVVMILKWDCYDIKRGKHSELSLDKSIGRDGENVTKKDMLPDLKISGIEALLVNELKKIGKQIQEYIQLDPDSQLRGCHVRDRPDINCQVLLQLRLLSEPHLTLQDISQRLQSPLQTIKSRLERNCLPIIRNIALELGYELEKSS